MPRGATPPRQPPRLHGRRQSRECRTHFASKSCGRIIVTLQMKRGRGFVSPLETHKTPPSENRSGPAPPGPEQASAWFLAPADLRKRLTKLFLARQHHVHRFYAQPQAG